PRPDSRSRRSPATTTWGRWDPAAIGRSSSPRRPANPSQGPVPGARPGGTAVGLLPVRPAGPGIPFSLGTLGPMASSDRTRLLLVEAVPQVAQYIRGLLNSQSSVKLLDVMTDGSKVIAQIQQLRPDVVLVDSLLQGKVKGLQLVEQIRDSHLNTPVIVLTVPQNPVATDVEGGIHGVLSMPFSGFDLLTRINAVRREYETTSTVGASRVFTVFAPT